MWKSVVTELSPPTSKSPALFHTRELTMVSGWSSWTHWAMRWDCSAVGPPMSNHSSAIGP